MTTYTPKNVHEAIKLGNVNLFQPSDALPPEATDALPGTEEKIAMLAERVEQGLPLYHPDDRRWYDEDES